MQPSTRQMKQQVKLPHGETDTALRVFAQGARCMSGSVMITRDTLAHPFFRAETYTEREAWLWIIMQARWKSGQARAGDLTVDLQRGELAASVRFMAEAWQWTPARVQRYIERLKKVKMICVKTDTGISVVTVCNYDKFQTTEADTDTGPIQDRYRTDTKENKDVIKEEGKEGKREAKASRAKPSSANVLSILSRVASPEVASEFISHRNGIKKPITDTMADGMVKLLAGHHDPDAVLNHSIANGYQGIFPDKIKRTGSQNGTPTGHGRLSAFIAGASSAPRVDSWPDSDPSQPLLARR